LAATLAAQSAPVPQERTPVISLTARIVQVSVVVHNKKGEPVSDLKKEDFSITDKGQEQQIRLFSMDVARPNGTPGASALPPGVVANREWSAGGSEEQHSTLPNSVTVILLDGLNSRIQDRHNAKRGLITFLKQIQPADRVAIYALGNGLSVIHDFTSDTAALVRAIERYESGQSWELDNSATTSARTGVGSMDAFLNAMQDKIKAYYQGRRIETTLESLNEIANHLYGVAGRKNLIWFSADFPILVGLDRQGPSNKNFQFFDEQVRKSMDLLNAAGIAVYPVDSRGLMGNSEVSPTFNA